MLSKFRKDPNYLAKYHGSVAAILFLINATIAWFQPPSWKQALWYLPALLLCSITDLQIVIGAFAYACLVSFISPDFNPLYLAVIPLAMLISFPVSGLIHAASHDSIRPRWLMRPIGEITSVIQLSGFPEWKVIHVIHHSNPDHPELDPHPPLNKSYWEFAKGMRASIGKVFIGYYFKCFGQNEKSISSVKMFGRASKLSMFMKVSFWYLVLGPQLFTFFFLTSIVFKMLHFAWFNYSTHRPHDDKIVIKNLDHRLYYFMNWLTFGLYYHDNHHTNPTLFNPKHLPAPRTPKRAAA